MLTGLYSAMHFLVDFLCAWAMFGFFQSGRDAYLNILIYNFCAFALQMPFGTLMDLLTARTQKKKWLALGCASFGAVLTAVGTLTHPAVLGVGNALFHVGGGLDVIQEDFSHNRGGRNLGIFVAPGALGLYFGTQLGKGAISFVPLIAAGMLLAVFVIFLAIGKQKQTQYVSTANSSNVKSIPILVLCCFVVVILRSFTGFAAGFQWKSVAILGFLAVVVTAGGKAAGGFLSSRFGPAKTMTVTLLLAAICFLLGDHAVFGLAALLLFNMSMPVTLYLLAQYLPNLPGFSFGLLTFGLFLGFLPVYFGVSLPIFGGVIGAAGSVISAGLLVLAWKAVNRGKVHT